jgi:type II pantothenate kinase
MLLVEPGRASRVGGTALGGGTLLGLAAALLGTSDFGELVRLAETGDRRRVDLLVADLEAGDAIPLPGEITAASLAKLATAVRADPADVAHALLGMIGENVGLLAGALAAATGARRVVYGGGLLRANPPLRAILARFAAFGPAQVFLENGEFAGAVGALARAEAT